MIIHKVVFTFRSARTAVTVEQKKTAVYHLEHSHSDTNSFTRINRKRVLGKEVRRKILVGIEQRNSG